MDAIHTSNMNTNRKNQFIYTVYFNMINESYEIHNLSWIIKTHTVNHNVIIQSVTYKIIYTGYRFNYNNYQCRIEIILDFDAEI